MRFETFQFEGKISYKLYHSMPLFFIGEEIMLPGDIVKTERDCFEFDDLSGSNIKLKRLALSGIKAAIERVDFCG